MTAADDARLALMTASAGRRAEVLNPAEYRAIVDAAAKVVLTARKTGEVPDSWEDFVTLVAQLTDFRE